MPPPTPVPEPAPAWRVERRDWAELAAELPAQTVDLVYADPPFNTGERRQARAGGFDDAWPSRAEFVSWLRSCLRGTVPALRPTGSLLLHLDQRTSHYAKVMLDDLLGPAHFINHLVWSYGLGGSSRRRFALKHDDILWYGATPGGHYFDPPMVPATSHRMAGRLKKSTDVLCIPSINNMAAERCGYPTQKPLALLDLLVRACCPPGGLVLDPCCGSGTTLVAAVAAGRRAVGGDINPDAVRIARERLAALNGRTPLFTAAPPAAAAP